MKAFLLHCLFAVLLVLSCASCTVSFDPQGNPTVTVDPVAAAQIANEIAERINSTK